MDTVFSYCTLDCGRLLKDSSSYFVFHFRGLFPFDPYRLTGAAHRPRPPKMLTRGRSVHQLLSLDDELLLKIIDCMTTTEGRGLLLCCRRLSDLARPNVLQKRQKEVRVL